MGKEPVRHVPARTDGPFTRTQANVLHGVALPVSYDQVTNYAIVVNIIYYQTFGIIHRMSIMQDECARAMLSAKFAPGQHVSECVSVVSERWR